MPRFEWDKTGERFYETGVRHGVLYPYDSETKKYAPGVPWNGLTSVQETPSGAEANAQYADDIKYLNLYSAEDFGATVEAFTYPKEFEVCDGSAELVEGINIGQQSRKSFGLSYTTRIGNDTDGNDHGYKLHMVYGAMASPSEKQYQTINDSPEPITFSWELTTTPANVKDHKPTALLTIDSRKVDATKLAELEDILYDESAAELPLPDAVYDMFSGDTPVPTDTYVLTEDTTVDPTKTYYVRSGSAEPYTYTAVENPEGNPQEQGWYEKVNG